MSSISMTNIKLTFCAVTLNLSKRKKATMIFVQEFSVPPKNLWPLSIIYGIEKVGHNNVLVCFIHSYSHERSSKNTYSVTPEVISLSGCQNCV